MKAEKRKDMNEKREMLLMRYADGECTVVERLYVKFFVLRSPEMVELFEEHSSENLREPLLEFVGAPELQSDRIGGSEREEFFHRVHRRIVEEERLELFHGKRNLPHSKDSFEGGFSAWIPSLGRVGTMGLGSVGAVSAGLVLVFLFGNGAETNTNFRPGASTISENVGLESSLQPTSVSFGGSSGRSVYSEPSVVNASRGSISGNERPVLYEDLSLPPVEVEWMRGSGRLQLIPNQETQLPIIWVNRNSSVRSRRNRESVLRGSAPSGARITEVSRGR